MSEWLEPFLRASGWVDIVDATREMSVRDDPADVPTLLAALKDPNEAKRWGAVYALGFSRRDGRVASPLIRVLLDEQETVRVRSQAAECLGYLGQRKAIRALIQCSRDDSAELRFWCVFALGKYRRRRRKPPIVVIRALEARLHDDGGHADFWTVGLEALAMLKGLKIREYGDRFRAKMLEIFTDPLGREDQWQWATWYWDISGLSREQPIRDLFDSAVERIHEAGLDPLTFGKQKPR